MKIEVLTFEGCANAHAAQELVERVVANSRVDAEVAHVTVPDRETAEQLRFLGSPTIRVDGRDVEPGAEERTEYVLACRIYRTEQGPAGTPDERWLRDALATQAEPVHAAVTARTTLCERPRAGSALRDGVAGQHAAAP